MTSPLPGVLLVAFALGVAGCHALGARAGARPGSPASTAPTAVREETEMAGGGVKSPRLAALAEEYWRDHLAARPIDATLLGIPGFDDRMPDESPRGRAHEKETLLSLRERLRATVAPADLNAIDTVTRGLLAEQLDADLAYADCHLEDWAVDPRDGPQVSYLDLAALQPVRTPADRQALVARWRAMSGTLDQITDNLLRGLAAGKVSARSEVE
ncbi:MAG: DUF885 family protein, partial [Polyangia bacterium]